MSASIRSRHSFTLVLLILVAFALRVFHLDAQSLWYDEGVTAMVAQLNWADLTRWTANDIQPPLYYYVIAFWGRMAGWSEWSLRFPSVFFGTLTVPLVAAVAQRLSGCKVAGVFAALLTALHPLLLYYSQEARMYAMLTSLAILAAYALAVYAVEPTRRWTLPVYILAATAAVYTHYFAFFLLLALGFAYLADQFVWQRRDADNRIWRSIGWYAAANGLLFLLYLPWLGAMLNRFSVDNSYWQGRLKVLEALRSLFISFVAGESVAQDVAVWMLVLYAAITLLAMVALIRTGSAGRRLLTYGLLWLLVPIVAVLMLTSYAPKFNPRYVLVALPGLLVIWAGGLGMKIKDRKSKIKDVALRASDDPQSPMPSPYSPTSLLPYLSLALLAAGFVYADVNWFFDPSFRKDQWREVTTDLRQNVQPHEAIVLVSGHAWPVWEYYASDLPVVLLPDIDVLDVDYVLDFSDTAAPMREAVEHLSDRPGVWLVGWQDEVVDPTGVVPVQLELAGREKGLDSRYWGIDLRRFSQLKANWITDEAPIEVPIDAVFADKVDDAVILRGYRPGDSGELLLFWALAEEYAPTDADYWMAGETLNADGEVVAQLAERRLSDYRYPSFRWPAERTVMGNLRPSDWLGADPQPGVYTFNLQVYDANQPAVTPLALPDGATTLTLGPIEVVVD